MPFKFNRLTLLANIFSLQFTEISEYHPSSSYRASKSRFFPYIHCKLCRVCPTTKMTSATVTPSIGSILLGTDPFILHALQQLSMRRESLNTRILCTLFSFIFVGLKFRENFLGTFRESLISRSRRKIVFAEDLISRNWRKWLYFFFFWQKLYDNQQLKQNQYAVP